MYKMKQGSKIDNWMQRNNMDEEAKDCKSNNNDTEKYY